MRSFVFCSCLTVFSIMRNTRLWQCRRGLCPSHRSTLCWRPIRMENSSLHVVIGFVQPQTWSCSPPSRTCPCWRFIVYSTPKKKSTENNKCQNLEQADCNNKFTCLFMLNFSIATMDSETYPGIIKKNIFSSFEDRMRRIDLSKRSAQILSAHPKCHGTRWYSGFSDIPGTKCYRYLIYPV
jgi:hypothetical protein